MDEQVNVEDGGGGSGRRKAAVAAVAGVGLVLVVGFLLFRPDKAFTTTEVNDSIPADVQQAISGTDVPDTVVTGVPDPSTVTGPVVLGSGGFVGQAGHSAVGEASVVELSDGRRQLVLENLDVENGPDLKLFLSPSSEGNVDGGVNLAPLRGNRGTQLYEIPSDVDLASLPNVVIWCERFSTPFGTATLSS